jgi:signal transduction histidine kinase
VTVQARAGSPTTPAVVTVTDTGPGIAPKDLPHVFTRFWRSADSSGSGLGMPIVRAIVEAHDGTVRVESDGRTGTQVIVELPVPGDHPVPPARQEVPRT